MRVTFLPPEQPISRATLAQRQMVKILDMVFSCFQVYVVYVFNIEKAPDASGAEIR
jgi:hypothetical protein